MLNLIDTYMLCYVKNRCIIYSGLSPSPIPPSLCPVGVSFLLEFPSVFTLPITSCFISVGVLDLKLSKLS